jgi:hypothetical protein
MPIDVERWSLPSKAAKWISRAFCEGDGSPSAKRLLFALTLLFVLGVCTGEIVARRSITPSAVDLLKTAMYVTGGAYVGGRFAECADKPLLPPL